MGDGSFAKEDVVRVMVNALLRFNNADMRVEMYHFCASLLRAAQQNALSFAFTQNDVDLFVTAYKQACSYSVRADEYYALLQVITDSPQPSSVPTVKEIKNPLFLQLALTLICASMARLYDRTIFEWGLITEIAPIHDWIYGFLTFFILFSYFVPMSLYVVFEFSRTVQAMFMEVSGGEWC